MAYLRLRGGGDLFAVLFSEAPPAGHGTLSSLSLETHRLVGKTLSGRTYQGSGYLLAMGRRKYRENT